MKTIILIICSALLCQIVISKTVLDYLKENTSFSKFVAAVESDLSAKTAFNYIDPDFCLTMFIPPNDKFNIPQESVTSILLNHYLTLSPKINCGTKDRLIDPGFNFDAPTKNNGFKKVLRNGDPITAYVYHQGDQTFVNGALLGQGTILRDNNRDIGIYYVIDKMLVTGYQERQFMEVLTQRSSLSQSMTYWKKYTENLPPAELKYFQSSFNQGRTYKTFFIPTNDAWNGLLAQQKTELEKAEFLKEILNYHFISGTVVYPQWGDPNPISIAGGIPGTAANTIKLLRNGVESKGTFSEIVESIPINLGVVHIINKPLGIASQTMPEALKSKAPAFDTFCGSKPSCVEMLNANIEGTIFAPQDGTFETLKTMANEENTLNLYLALHLMATKYQFITLQDSQTVEISNKGQLRFRTINEKKYVEARLMNEGFVRCEIIESDINTKQGTLHIVKGIMGYATSNALDFIKNHENTKKYSEYVTISGFEPALNFVGPFTIFAPSDQAFQKMMSDQDGSAIVGQTAQMIKVMRRTIILNKMLIEEAEMGSYSMATANYGNYKEYLNMDIMRNTSFTEAWKQRTATIKFQGNIPVLLQHSGYRTTNGLVYFIDTIPYDSDDREAPKFGEFKSIGDDSSMLTVSFKSIIALLLSALLLRNHL